MRNVSGTRCRENQNTQQFVFNTPHHHPQKNAIYEIVWKNIAEPDRPQMTVYCMLDT